MIEIGPTGKQGNWQLANGYDKAAVKYAPWNGKRVGTATQLGSRS